jgi:hypothetical protein
MWLQVQRRNMAKDLRLLERDIQFYNSVQVRHNFFNEFNIYWVLPIEFFNSLLTWKPEQDQGLNDINENALELNDVCEFTNLESVEN